MTPEVALEVIAGRSGTQFDPSVVEGLRRALTRHEWVLRDGDPASVTGSAVVVDHDEPEISDLFAQRQDLRAKVKRCHGHGGHAGRWRVVRSLRRVAPDLRWLLVLAAMATVGAAAYRGGAELVTLRGPVLLSVSLFGLAVAFGEMARLAVLTGRETAPMSTAAALGLSLSALPQGGDDRLGAAPVVVVIAAAMLLGSTALRVSGRTVSWVDVAACVAGISVAPYLYRSVHFGDLTLVQWQGDWSDRRWLVGVIMVLWWVVPRWSCSSPSRVSPTRDGNIPRSFPPSSTRCAPPSPLPPPWSDSRRPDRVGGLRHRRGRLAPVPLPARSHVVRGAAVLVYPDHLSTDHRGALVPD